MKRFNRFFMIAAVTAIFFGVGCARQTPGLNAASLTPDQLFTLKDAGGMSVSLAGELKNHKAVLLNFWATWCPPCREEIPDLIKLQAQNEKRGFTILGVDVGESAKHVAAFGQKMGMNYPLLLDADQQVSEQYHVVGIPTSILVSPSGKILGEYHAATPELAHDVDEALKA